MKTPDNKQGMAIKFDSGPAIVIAGPGSGKTYTIIERVKFLISNYQVSPDNILVVTFSKAAANEMNDRFDKTANDIGVSFCTFHSLAYRIIKEFKECRNYSVISERNKCNLLINVLKNYGYIDNSSLENVSEILEEISKYKNSENYSTQLSMSNCFGISDDDINNIFNDYDNILKEQNLLDFDDMIIMCLDKIRKNENKLNYLRQKYKYIMVDEFQDINMPQYDLIKLLAYPLNNLMVVGDDDQSIYGFRGSNPDIMNKFMKDFPTYNEFLLTNNYRSGKEIVEFAHNIIKNNKNRINKEFISFNDDSKICFKLFESRKTEEENILQLLHSLDKKEIENTALIVRTNNDAALWNGLFNQNNIAVYHIEKEKTSLTDSFVYEDISSFIKYVYFGQRREDFIKIMNKPQKYIQRSAINNEIIIPNDVISYYQKNDEMFECLKKFFNLLNVCKNLSVKSSVNMFRKVIGYDRYLYGIAKTSKERQRLHLLADEYEKLLNNCNINTSKNEFFDNLINIYESPVNDKLCVKKGINIITMHTAKGLEFENVILPDVNEGIIPIKTRLDENIEEECRLLYVAVTRAKKNLYIFATKERNRKISRFIVKLVKI